MDGVKEMREKKKKKKKRSRNNHINQSNFTIEENNYITNTAMLTSLCLCYKIMCLAITYNNNISIYW